MNYNEPTELRAGVTWEWTRDSYASDYPASSWTFKYWFKRMGSGGGNFSIVPVASGDNFAVSVLPSVTKDYVAGDYTWVLLATLGTDTRELESGKIKVLPRYDLAASLDDRSHARKVLDAVKAVLENRATSTQRELVGFTIGSRSQQFDQGETKLKLLELKSKYEWLVFDEENAAGVARGEPNQRLIRVRFDQS